MEFRQIFLRNTLTYLEFVRQLIYIQKFKSGLARPIQKITLEGITFNLYNFVTDQVGQIQWVNKQSFESDLLNF